ncbi:MAG: cysteine synthase A [Bacteroidales bacterium]|nr:cysteine synthase A [Bacteroidales bacterium]
MLVDRITQLIGNTPLLHAKEYEKNVNAEANIFVKLEYLNPAGSVKDRAALYMVEDAERRGILKPDATIIEPTSGNTGVGLALVASVKGYKLILTMPESMSIERRKLLAARGAIIELTPASAGMKGAVDRAKELQSQIDGAVILQQFDNPANAEAHYQTTANEIWNDLNGKVDIFVAGVGTGGTISGNGKRLKELNSNVKIVAVEPAESALLSGKSAGPHKIQGIGANFIPSLYNGDVVDEIIPVSGEDAYVASRLISATEGVLVGISSGAALHAASILASRPENKGKNIVVLLPDTGERYLSTDLF